MVLHGPEFNLKTLSCLTLYADDCAAWCQGLKYLAEDVRRASNRLHQVRVGKGLCFFRHSTLSLVTFLKKQFLTLIF